MTMRPPNLLLALSDAPRAVTDAAFLTMTAPLLRRLPGTPWAASTHGKLPALTPG